MSRAEQAGRAVRTYARLSGAAGQSGLVDSLVAVPRAWCRLFVCRAATAAVIDDESDMRLTVVRGCGRRIYDDLHRALKGGAA